ncbi:GSCOCG00005625001-RA-CDS [Cotesia congregata]|nr:GSCOCG00005625001-RA-CDS [Cotesia congregata]
MALKKLLRGLENRLHFLELRALPISRDHRHLQIILRQSQFL